MNNTSDGSCPVMIKHTVARYCMVCVFCVSVQVVCFGTRRVSGAKGTIVCSLAVLCSVVATKHHLAELLRSILGEGSPNSLTS